MYICMHLRYSIKILKLLGMMQMNSLKSYNDLSKICITYHLLAHYIENLNTEFRPQWNYK